MSDALKAAWRNFKLRAAMAAKICKFYFLKVDGTIREAYGTLASGIIPETAGNDTRKKNETVQTYFDTEKQEWRCYKRANLIRIEY
jgi:hypothetical protein